MTSAIWNYTVLLLTSIFHSVILECAPDEDKDLSVYRPLTGKYSYAPTLAPPSESSCVHRPWEPKMTLPGAPRALPPQPGATPGSPAAAPPASAHGTGPCSGRPGRVLCWGVFRWGGGGGQEKVGPGRPAVTTLPSPPLIPPTAWRADRPWHTKKGARQKKKKQGHGGSRLLVSLLWCLC